VVISTRHARGLPDRRPEAQAGTEWLAPRTTGPAGWSPRRDEITTSSRRARNDPRGTCTEHREVTGPPVGLYPLVNEPSRP
jgi:hypothetical protein